MARPFERERGLRHSYLSGPLVAAGILSDAVCCEGPKRDFIAEKNFRLQNAMKMYPTGYDLGPHAFDYSKQYVHAVPQYPVQVARAPQPFLQHQGHVVVKPIQYTYASSYPSGQTPPRIYRYVQPVYSQPDIPPPICFTASGRPFPEAPTKWTWENHGGREGGYLPPPPLESMSSFPEVGLRTVSTLPENTPRDGYFSTSLPKIVEVVRVEGETGPIKATDNTYVPKPVGDEDFAESEPEDEGDTRKPEIERTTPTEREKAQRKEREDREPIETPKEEEQDDSRNNVTSSTNEKKDETQEGEQHAEDGASSDVSSELMSRGETPFDEENQEGGEGRECLERNEGEEEREEESMEKEGKKENVGFGKQDDDEPEIPGEITNNFYAKNSKVKFETQATDESLKQFPMFSMTTASTFSGIDFMTTPRPEKMEGEVFKAADVGPNKFGFTNPTIAYNWPIGYVPPPDQKYKKLVLGNQVYYEGGTFYLSETGAFLLGLRG